MGSWSVKLDGFGAAVAEVGFGALADAGEMFPAAGAAPMGGHLHEGEGIGDFAAAVDFEDREDEEFFENGKVVEDGVVEGFFGQGEFDEGVEVGADEFFLTGFLDGLLDDGAHFKQFVNNDRRVFTGKNFLNFWELLKMHAFGMS